ncbi:MAG: NADP-dependent malic enzyme [Candidatus Saccharimonadales bacterium]
MDIKKQALAIHKELKGKITIALKDNLSSQEKLSLFYTPGVAAVSLHLAKHPELTRDYTWTNNLVAVISDGSAVLGLGDIGPYGALPVMEGKSMLFKHFANIDAVPIVLNVHSADDIVNAVKAIAPSFGGINLEDIAAPICFEVEDRLKKELSIPVMHDDQHGTAIVTLAGLINATKVVKKDLTACKIVLIGSGAAGVAIAKLLHDYAHPDIIVIDSKGVISPLRSDLNIQKKELSTFHKHSIKVTTLEQALVGADIVIGISKEGILTSEMIRSMAKNPIVFAMANPNPEIMPSVAVKAGAAVIATGRSDFPNQVNNALAFPGIFRGALDNKIASITEHHKIRAAEVIAGLVDHPKEEFIIPSVLDPRLVPAIAAIVV